LAGTILLSLVLIGLSFLVSIQQNPDQDALMFVSFCLTPLLFVVQGISTFYRATNNPKGVTLYKWIVPTVLSACFLVGSPAIGYFAPGAACNAIHRLQLEPVRGALLEYRIDSARFPIGVQALIPYYLEEPPRLLCFGTLTRYRLLTCDRAVMLDMDDFYGDGTHRLFLISGDWETSNDEPRVCEPMG
jgi:hypothetical protein